MKLEGHPVFEKQDPAKRPQYLVELLEDLFHERGFLSLLEIGSIRVDNDEYHDGDGHSTLYLGRFARKHKLKFTTVDLDVTTCRQVIEREELADDVEVVQEEGTQYLFQQRSNTRDFVYLDGPDDAEWTITAFVQAARVTKPTGLIALDDCEDMDDVSHKPDAEKGRLLIPILQEMGVPIRRTGKKIVVVRVEDLICAP